MTLLELDARITEHESWFKDNTQGKRLSLKDVVIQDQDLSGRRLNQAEFENTVFEGCRFVGTKMHGTSWAGCRFANCNLEEAAFDFARGRGVVITDSVCNGTSFCDIIWRDVSFIRCGMRLATFTKGQVEGFSIAGCDLVGAGFRRATFNAGTFKDCDFAGSDAVRSWWTRLEFHKVGFRNVDFEGAKILDAGFAGTSGLPKSVAEARMEKLYAIDPETGARTPINNPWPPPQ